MRSIPNRRNHHPLVGLSILLSLTAFLVPSHGIAQNRSGMCGTDWSTLGPFSGQLEGRLGVTTPMARPAMQTSIVSPAGHFRVHFDTTGVHEGALLDTSNVRITGTARAYADSIAAAFDRSWSVMVEELGFDAPLADIDGGDGRYDVYIMSLSSSLFGETQFAAAPFQIVPNSRYETWIVIDNDFMTQRTKGLDGAHVTAAHEFFHAVQVGQYGFWGQSDAYWYEISSAWIEDEVYPGANDYLSEVSHFMTSYRTRSFTEYSTTFRGYERVVFAQYLAERFGRSVIRNVWERIREERVLPSLVGAVSSIGTSFETVFSGFAKWTFYTADRSDPIRYYTRGPLFPRLEPIVQASLLGEETTLSYDFPPLSLGLFAVRVDADTIFVMLTNTDVASAIQGNIAVSSPSVVLSRTAQDRPSQTLVRGVTAGLETVDPSVWDIEYFMSSTADIAARTGAEPFPNPWVLSSPFDLAIPTTGALGSIVQVYLVSPDLRSISLGPYAVTEEKGRSAVRISSSTVRGKAGSGAYVAVVRRDDGDDMAKIVIIQ